MYNKIISKLYIFHFTSKDATANQQKVNNNRTAQFESSHNLELKNCVVKNKLTYYTKV